MDSKKIQSVINAEEQHLASKSTKKVVKKTTKTTSKTTKLKEQLSYQYESIDEATTTATTTKTQVQVPDIDTHAIGEDKKAAAKTEECKEQTATDLSSKKKSKSKKNKKCEFDTQNISVKSSFSKFDALQKRNLIHVRSSDTGKAQEIFSNPQEEKQTNCRLCQKPVYKMEEIKAEKSIFHKNCFRCHECAKQLKVDNYQSHSGDIYCLVHFKLLFAPKVVEDTETTIPRKAELIIRESQPVELPPDVVRASDKPDLGLEELSQQLNVRSRFQVFENAGQIKPEPSEPPKPTEVKRSTSILTKLVKLQQQHGLSADCEYSNSDVSESEDDSDTGREGSADADIELKRSKKRTQRERPVGLGDAMNDIKSKFENGHLLSKEERREERKQEIQNIRSRLFMGKQAKIKEMYQQAVAESEQGVTSVGKKPDVEIGNAARSIKERFEKGGDIFNSKITHNDEFADETDVEKKSLLPSAIDKDKDLFESAISKQSRSIFMELDANVASGKTQSKQPVLENKRNAKVSNNEQENMAIHDPNSAEVVKYDEQPEDVKVATSEISQKFKFFETYRPTESEKPRFRMTPPRDGVVKMPTPESDTEHQTERKLSFTDNILQKTQTTSAMLNKFREMEQNTFASANKADGPRPLKCFTPPPDEGRRYYQEQNSDDDDETDTEDSGDNESEDGEPAGGWKTATAETDEALREAQAQARAKQLRAKFEKWQANEIQRELNEDRVDIYSQQVSDDTTIESTKTIRERFENMKNFERKNQNGPRYQVNRFV